MGDFFHGWRRKTGRVTLLMACGFMGAWLKDLSGSASQQRVSFYSGRQTLEHLQNGDGGRIWWIHYYPNPDSDIFTFNDCYRGWNIPPTFTEERWEHIRIFGKSVFYEFRFCVVHSVEANGFLISVSHWSIVIPLTMLSAWLLLSKPRSSNPKKIAEPIPETAA